MTDENKLQRMDSAPPALAFESESASILAVIARAATDPSVDMDKMERLLAMQERITAKQAEKAFNDSMKIAQERMPRIKKDARNSQTNSNYARLESLNRAIVPVYTEQGFSLSYGSSDCPIEKHRRITCRVSHSAGHSRDYCLDLPLDMLGMKGSPNKTEMHAFGSTISYGRRYLAMMIFNISTTDDDDGNAAGGSAEGPEVLIGLKKLLWDLLVKHEKVPGRGGTWEDARRYLVDEDLIEQDLPINDFITNAVIMRTALKKLTAKLEGAK